MKKDDDIIPINDIISKIPNNRKQNYIFNNTTDQTTDTREFKGLSFKENNEIINSIDLRDQKNSISLKCIFKDIKRIKTIKVVIQNIYGPNGGSKTASYQYDLLDKTTYYKNVEDIIKENQISIKNEYLIQDDWGNRHHWKFQEFLLNEKSIKNSNGTYQKINMSSLQNNNTLRCVYNDIIEYCWKRNNYVSHPNNDTLTYHYDNNIKKYEKTISRYKNDAAPDIIFYSYD